MRRLALSVFAACGLAILAGCSSGTGIASSGTNTSGAPTFIGFNGGSGEVNDYFVANTPAAVVSITATAEKGTGVFADVLPDREFYWGARLVDPSVDPPSISNYQKGAVPNGFTRCPAKPSPSPLITSIYTQGPDGSLAPLGGNLATTVFVGPQPGITAAAYCIYVQARDSSSGVIGGVTVVVSNSP